MLNKKSFVITILFVTAFSIYLSSINSSFHLDDYGNISQNTSVIIDELSFKTLNKAASSAVNAGFRPLAYISFALNYYISGEDTTSYHVVNVMLHIINALLVYLVILALFDYGEADSKRRELLSVSAFFTALFWLVTPLNSQAVIYIVQRMTLMMTLFFLLAFLFYIKARKEKKTFFLVLSAFSFILSFISKQNAMVFPLVIILYELIFIRKGDLKNVSRNEKVILVALFFLLILPVFIFKDLILALFKNSELNWDFTYYERELTQFRVLAYCLSLLVLPLPSRLNIMYDIPKSTSLFKPWTTFPSIIFITGLFILSITRIKKSPYFSFAILWFFITISVEVIAPVELMYDHRMYLPSIFLFGAVVHYLTQNYYSENKRVLLPAFLALIVTLGVLTGIRGTTWKDELTLWKDTLEKSPHSSLALTMAGIFSYTNEDYDMAEKYLIRAINEREYADIFKDAYWCLGNTYYHKKQYRKAIMMYKRVFEYYLEDIPIVPGASGYDELFISLANSYISVGDIDNALVNYKKAIGFGLKQNSTKNLGTIYNNIGTIYLNTKRYEEASEYLKKALEYQPGNKTIQKNLLSAETLLKK